MKLCQKPTVMSFTWISFPFVPWKKCFSPSPWHKSEIQWNLSAAFARWKTKQNKNVIYGINRNFEVLCSAGFNLSVRHSAYYTTRKPSPRGVNKTALLLGELWKAPSGWKSCDTPYSVFKTIKNDFNEWILWTFLLAYLYENVIRFWLVLV